MASKYDDLDASTELEQALTADLTAALAGRGCEVVHHGTNSGGRHSPGGKPDIEIRDQGNSRLILVEVTKRQGSAADGEFPAITDHFEKAIAEGGYTDYGMLYISPATSARMSTKLRDLWNRDRERSEKPGRVVALDFEAVEMLLTRLIATPSEQYPASGFGDLFARWKEAADDSRARLLVQQSVLPDDLKLGQELEAEVAEAAAESERRLKKQLEQIENDLRDDGVTGDAANVVLTYLTFLRLYEERRQRETGAINRFTAEGFDQWRDAQGAAVRNRYPDRMVEALLHEVAEDDDLRAAGLLRDAQGKPQALNAGVKDSFVTAKLLPVFDLYDFHAGRVDLLGAVFETLARRGEKDTRVGQFFTPQSVVDFCARIVPLTPRDLVLDPAVGTARFLIKAMDVMVGRAESTKDVSKVRATRLIGTDIGDWVATIAKMNMLIHGDGKTNIKRANGLVLGDRGCFDRFPKGISAQVDVVLTNPPLGDTSHQKALGHWQALADDGQDTTPNTLLDRLGVIPMRVVEKERLRAVQATVEDSERLVESLEAALPDPEAQQKLPSARRTLKNRVQRAGALQLAIGAGKVTREPVNQSMKGGALFLGAVADYLKPVRDPDALVEWRGGWAGIVLDEAILNTPDYGPVREFIRDKFYVKAIVSLGREAFRYLAHTDAKTSVAFLVRKPEDGKVQTEPIFYAHAEHVGYGRTGKWVGDDLPNVEAEFGVMAAAVRDAYKGSRLGTDDAMNEVEKLPGFGTAFHAMPDPGGTARLDFFHARYVQRTTELRERFGEPPRLGEYVEVVPREHPQPNRRGEYRFAEVSRVTGTVRDKGIQTTDYTPSQLWVLVEGDLIVSGIDAVHGSVGVAGADVAGAVMSPEMYAYRVKDASAACAGYLALILRSRQALDLLEGMSTGTSNRTRLESAEQLLDLPVPPLPPIAEQRKVASLFDESVSTHRLGGEMKAEAEFAASTAWHEEDQPLDRVSLNSD